MSRTLSPWTMPILRIGMAVFLAYWGFDKIMDTGGAQGIYAGFYQIEGASVSFVQIAGGLQVAYSLILGLGLLRVPAAWVQLAMNTVSTGASWRQILDPWAVWGLREGGNAHLFLASIVVMAVSVVLVLNARDDVFTLDKKLGRGRAV